MYNVLATVSVIFVGLGTICVLVDFLTGERSRETLKESLGDFWLELQYSSLGDMFVTALKSGLNRVERGGLRGNLVFSLVASSLAISPLLMLWRSGNAFIEGIAQIWLLKYGPITFSISLALVIPFCIISTFFLLEVIDRRFAVGMSWRAIVTCVIAAAFKAVEISSVVCCSISAFVVIYMRGIDLDLSVILASLSSVAPDKTILSLMVIAGFGMFVLLALVTIAFVGFIWPILLVIALLTLIALLRACKRYLDPAVSLVIYRFYEDRRGPLSLLGAAFIGFGYAIQRLMLHG